MKIGIDCRLWGIKHAGIGRYTEELVRNLLSIDKKDEFILFCRKADHELLPGVLNSRKVMADIPHYGFAEQLKLPKIFARENLDLLHTPHFNVPLLYWGKFVVTIHDLLWHEIRSWKATTLSAPQYAVKYLAYRGAVRNTVSRAQKIIVPSNTVKKDVVKRFGLPDDKVVVTYEGAPDSKTKNQKPKTKIFEKYRIKGPYIFYVGSLYPHKNVEVIVHALKLLQDKNLKLVVVSARNVFLSRFEQFVKDKGAEALVNLAGRVPDEDLATLYTGAEAFVFPSLSEGFGLPGLEAMAAGAPVIASDIPVFHEVYGSAALYFEPTNPASIATKIEQVLKDKKIKSDLISIGRKRAKQFSWRKMAEETLRVYTSVV